MKLGSRRWELLLAPHLTIKGMYGVGIFFFFFLFSFFFVSWPQLKRFYYTVFLGVTWGSYVKKFKGVVGFYFNFVM